MMDFFLSNALHSSIVFFIVAILIIILGIKGLLSFNYISIRDEKEPNRMVKIITNQKLYFNLVSVLLVLSSLLYTYAFISELSSNMNYSLNIKIMKCTTFYIYTVILCTFSFSFLDFCFSYKDKCDEFEHYVSNYSHTRKEIPVYDTKHYLNGKTKSWFRENTMYSSTNGFSNTFKELYTSTDKRNLLKELIQIDYKQSLLCLAELFYFSLVIISTLGFGDITPKYTYGKFLTSVFILIGQFVTLLMFAKILA